MFLLAAQNFNRKVVSAAVGLDSAIEKTFRQPAFARRAAPASVQQAAQTGLALANDLAESFLEGDDHLDGGSGDIRNESLRYFADAWNAVLHDMRQVRRTKPEHPPIPSRSPSDRRLIAI